MNRRILAAVLLMFVIALPGAARAAGSPQDDPRCWKKEQCEAFGGEGGSGGGTVTTAFDPSEECGAGWGYCYNEESIPLAVPLPGRDGEITHVANFGAYIAAIYRWGVPFAAVLAVIVMMAGGLYWMVGGATGQVQKAKQMISNAAIGLVLTMFSYLILQTINPDLVKLALPRTQMLRSVLLGADWCRDVPESARQPQSEFMLKGKDVMWTYGTDGSALKCNSQYTALGVSGACWGSGCPSGEVCVPTGASTFACQRGTMAINVQYTSDDVNGITLMQLCADGSMNSLNNLGSTRLIDRDHEQQFVVTGAAGQLRTACDDGNRQPAGGLLLVNASAGDAWVVGRGCQAAIPVRDASGEQVWTPWGIVEVLDQDDAAAATAFETLREQMWSLDELRSGNVTCKIRYTEDSPAFPDV